MEYLIDDNQLNYLDRLKSRLFDENKMDENEMRDAAQKLDGIVKTCKEIMFSNNNYALMSLISEIERTIGWNKPGVPFEMLYNVVFKHHKDVISPLIEKIGAKFSWCDPDTSYQEDVEAYLEAIAKFRDDLYKMV